MLWSHITRIVADDTGELWKTKLRHEHINLTPRTKMSVRLAVQVKL